MVPQSTPAFLDLSDGKVLGKAVPAAAADSIAINPLPTRKPKNLRPKPVIEKVKGSHGTSQVINPLIGGAAPEARR